MANTPHDLSSALKAAGSIRDGDGKLVNVDSLFRELCGRLGSERAAFWRSQFQVGGINAGGYTDPCYCWCILDQMVDELADRDPAVLEDGGWDDPDEVSPGASLDDWGQADDLTREHGGAWNETDEAVLELDARRAYGLALEA